MPFIWIFTLLLLFIPVPAPWASPAVLPESILSESFLSTRREQRLNRRLHELSQAREGRSKPYLKGKRILDLTLEDACRHAVHGNFDLRLARLDHRIAARERTVKEASFDPVFDLSLSYRKVDAYERFEEVGRVRRRIPDLDALLESFRERAEVDDPSELSEEEETDCVGCSPCIYVDGVLLNPSECLSQYAYSVEREYASFTMKHGTIPDVWTLSLRASKAFRWGQEVDITVQSRNRTNPYPSLGPYAALYTYDEGVFEFPYGDNPWSSSLTLNASTPLPFCKSFGAYGSFDHVDSLLAETRTKTRAREVEDMERVLAESVQKAYWDLVWALTRLDILMEGRRTLEALAARTRRLFEWGYKTAYDKAQVEAELRHMENREEVAWNDLMVRSSRLMELLGQQGDVVILPVRYSRALIRSLNTEFAPSIAGSLERRPDLKALQTEHEAARVRFEYRKNQVLPDLELSCRFGLSQTDTYWGYSSLKDSWEHLAEPDNHNYYIGLVFRWPLGNHAAKSAFRRSRSALRKSEKTVTNKINHIVNEINDSQSSVKTTRRMVSFACEAFKSSSSTYKKAVEMRGNDQQITDFELLNKHKEWITSKLNMLNALIAYQKSRAELLSARGRISLSFREDPREGRRAASTAGRRGPRQGTTDQGVPP